MKGTKIDNVSLASLLKENLQRIPLDQIVNYKKDFDQDSKLQKRYGVTYGAFKKLKSSGETWLIKKSGRQQETDEYGNNIGHEPSSKTILLKQYQESFEENCGAKLFQIIKGHLNSSVETLLCESDFTASTKKPYNNPKIASDLKKIYVASKVIGNEKEVNLDRKIQNNEILKSLDPMKRQEVISDLCETAIEMMIILNYDLKLDNFVFIDDRFVAIDFGNCRYEEKGNPDIISAIDEIRSVSTKTNNSNRFSSKGLTDRFSDDNSSSTKRFYNQNLKPIHFLNVIQKLETNEQLEDQIRQCTQIYSFGDEVDKRDHADVIMSRIQNLIALKDVFTSLHVIESGIEESLKEKAVDLESPKKGPRKFAQLNLRSKYSRDPLLTKHINSSSRESSPACAFLQDLNKFFDDNKSYIDSIIAADQKDDKSQLEQVRKEYGEFLDNSQHSLISQIDYLEGHYKEGYLSTRKWQNEKVMMINNINSIIETLHQPFFFKKENNLLEQEDDLFEQNEEIDFEYLKEYIDTEKREMNSKISEIMTYLLAYDKLNSQREKSTQLQEDNKSKDPSSSSSITPCQQVAESSKEVVLKKSFDEKHNHGVSR